jgi:Fe-S-cluster containining protein
MTDRTNNPHSRVALMAVNLTDPEGTVRGKVQVDTGPMRLAELVPTAFELTNVLTGRANKREEKAGRTISCAKGCAACCRQMVPVSPPEAFFLMDLIESLQPEQQAEVIQRFGLVVSELERHNLVDELLDPQVTDDSRLEIARKYWGLQMPCPFLVNEACSIHPSRPVACREFNVTTPAEWCSEPYDHEVAKVPMPFPLSLPLARLTAQLTESKPTLIPLTLVPRWTADHAELGQQTWPGLDLFKRFISLMGPQPPDSTAQT